MNSLVQVLGILTRDAILSAHYRDYALKGSWNGYRELHIEGDWLLIYKISADVLYLARTGSHAELFQR